jgi:hypothetical protein
MLVKKSNVPTPYGKDNNSNYNLCVPVAVMMITITSCARQSRIKGGALQVIKGCFNV